MPRMIDVIIVKNIVGSNMPPERSRRADASFKPTPVFVTTPMMMPAEAQATRTPRTFRAPFSKPRTISTGFMRVDFLRDEAAMASTIAQSAARIGVKPETSR